jgi:hypothetical protein
VAHQELLVGLAQQSTAAGADAVMLPARLVLGVRDGEGN